MLLFPRPCIFDVGIIPRERSWHMIAHVGKALPHPLPSIHVWTYSNGTVWQDVRLWNFSTSPVGWERCISLFADCCICAWKYWAFTSSSCLHTVGWLSAYRRAESFYFRYSACLQSHMWFEMVWAGQSVCMGGQLVSEAEWELDASGRDRLSREHRLLWDRFNVLRRTVLWSMHSNFILSSINWSSSRVGSS